MTPAQHLISSSNWHLQGLLSDSKASTRLKSSWGSRWAALWKGFLHVKKKICHLSVLNYSLLSTDLQYAGSQILHERQSRLEEKTRSCLSVPELGCPSSWGPDTVKNKMRCLRGCYKVLIRQVQTVVLYLHSSPTFTCDFSTPKPNI